MKHLELEKQFFVVDYSAEVPVIKPRDGVTLTPISPWAKGEKILDDDPDDTNRHRLVEAVKENGETARFFEYTAWFGGEIGELTDYYAMEEQRMFPVHQWQWSHMKLRAWNMRVEMVKRMTLVERDPVSMWLVYRDDKGRKWVIAHNHVWEPMLIQTADNSVHWLSPKI